LNRSMSAATTIAETPVAGGDLRLLVRELQLGSRYTDAVESLPALTGASRSRSPVAHRGASGSPIARIPATIT
jgi:hypothetical protein